MIAIDGRNCWTLFHPSTRNTYVTPSVAELLKTYPTPRPVRTALGGAMKESNYVALLEGEIQHHPVSTHAFVVEEIGEDEDGNPIEILFGALAMQQWGIRLKPFGRETRLVTLSKGTCGILIADNLSKPGSSWAIS
jgi:hypothetical protein